MTIRAVFLVALAFVVPIAAGGATLAATPDEIFDANRAASGGAVWQGSHELKTEYDVAGQGLTGTAHGVADLQDGRYAQYSTTGPRSFGRGFDGRHSWIVDNSGIVTLQDGADARQLAVNAAYRNANLWWRAGRGGAAITPRGQAVEAGRTFDVLDIVPQGGESFTAWFDAKSHLLARVKEYYGEALYTTAYDDYRPYDGAMIAVRITVGSGNAQYDQHYTLTKVLFLATSEPSSYAPPSARVADFVFAGSAHETTFPFVLNNNHTHASVMIDGKGPYSFLFDTGAQNLVTPEVAADIGATVQGHSEMRGVGEGSTDWGLTTFREVRIGGVTLRDQLFGVIALHNLYPTNGIEMQGMIGSETFRRFVTRIDYGARTFTLIDPGHFDPADAGRPIKVAFNYNEVVVDGSFDGIPGKFQIDSGSRNALTLNMPFARTNGLIEKYAKGVDAVDGWGLGGPSHAHVARGGVLRLGSLALRNLAFGIGTDKGGAYADTNKSGLIGGGILKRYVVTFDYGHALMYLKPIAAPIADIDTYDRAGMWINAEAHAFDVVATTPGGPADAAGLKIGDVITAIDGKTFSGDDLGAARMRLRNASPGTKIALAVRRAGQTLQITLTLRDQI